MTGPQQVQAIREARERVTNPDPWLTVPQIAELMGVSRMTIYRSVRADYLRSVRIGRSIRIRTSWLMAWVEAGCPVSEDPS